MELPRQARWIVHWNYGLLANPSMSVSNFAFGWPCNSVCTYTYPWLFSEWSRALQASLSRRV